MDNTQPPGAGEVLTIAALLLIIGVVGRWDYDDALASERAAAEATARKLMCEETIGNAVPGRRNHADQAADVLVLRCIVVAD